MPSARTAAGSASSGMIRAIVSSGISRPESSTIRFMELRFRIGMMPGTIGKSTPIARHRSTRPK